MKTKIEIISIFLLISLLFLTACESHYCGDETCGENENSDNCPLDCGCNNGYYLEGKSCYSECGDGIKTTDEDSNNCCLDAGCSAGNSCIDNVCIELKPEINFNFNEYFDQESVTLLKSSKEDIEIGTLHFYNVGNDDAKNFKIKISSPDGYFESETINLGTIYAGSDKEKNLELNFDSDILEIVDETDITIDLYISYDNSVNKKYTDSESATFEVLGRNSISSGHPYSYTAWVTPKQDIIREFASKSTSGLAGALSQTDQDLAARWLFESMQSYGINYVNDIKNVGDYVQLPYETLKRRNGDCEDLAVLYASLLEAVGIESRLVRIPGHLFAGYINLEGYIVPVETTASNFDSALAMGNNEYIDNMNGNMEVVNVRNMRSHYSEAIVDDEPYIPLPDITKELGECEISWNFQDFWVASLDINLVNTGDSPGAGCVAVTSIQDGELIDEIFQCWTLNPGEELETTLEPDISIFDGYYCVSY